MKLVATQDFTYADKALKAGDSFDTASDEDARILKVVGRAKDAANVQRPADGDMPERPANDDNAAGLFEAKTQPQRDEAEKPKKYNRRDMRAKE